MITVLYFASIREHMGRGEDRLEAVEDLTTVAAVIRHLSETDSSFKELSQSPNPPLISVNQVFAETSSPISDGDEVGFFPPMTGG
ncbi:MAG: MoaD/ThiS family protein [Pseudohongiellaceae bacterium]